MSLQENLLRGYAAIMIVIIGGALSFELLWWLHHCIKALTKKEE